MKRFAQREDESASGVKQRSYFRANPLRAVMGDVLSACLFENVILDSFINSAEEPAHRSLNSCQLSRELRQTGKFFRLAREI